MLKLMAILSRLCERSGMKTTWVLTEEERKKKFEERRKPRKPRSGSSDETGDGGTIPARVGMSAEELLEVDQYVKISGHWDLSKVNDMNTNLIREFIRYVEYVHERLLWCFQHNHLFCMTLLFGQYSENSASDTSCFY